MSRHPTAGELNAFVDGELDLARRLEIEALLAADAGLRAEAEALRALRDGLRARADYHVAPAALRGRLGAMLAAQTAAASAEHAAAPQRIPQPVPQAQPASARPASAALRGWLARWFAWRPFVSACGVLATLTLAVNLALVGGRADDRLGDEIVASHVRATLSDRAVDVASSDHHTVKPWLSARLDYSPPVPDRLLPDTVFLGGRLDYVNGRQVAALAYRQGRHAVDAYLWPERGADSAPAFSEERGFRLARWTRGGMAHWVVSDLNREEFGRLVARLADD
ncbi:anti-sigma factor family protein [Derxia lacustris]|uniref:anti-sigma factor family protein n=1 Tax=Derxia lacustris TaxID=764842 RepID=UPI000A177B60|nr:anti-sigma factor [Derxia lacustris]